MRRQRPQQALTLALLFLPCLSIAPSSVGRGPRGQTARDEAPTNARTWLIGSWHGARRDGADGSESALTSRFEAILDGVGLSERIEVTQSDGAIYRGFATEVLDPTIGRWVRMYVNATRRHFARLEGEEDGENRLVWRSVSPDRIRENRIVTERIGPDRWRRTSSISEDGGTTWRVLFVDELERDTRPDTLER